MINTYVRGDYIMNEKQQYIFNQRQDILDEIKNRTDYIEKHNTFSLLTYIYGFRGLGKTYLMKIIKNKLLTPTIYFVYNSDYDISDVIHGLIHTISANIYFASIDWKEVKSLYKQNGIPADFSKRNKWGDSIPYNIISTVNDCFSLAAPIPTTVIKGLLGASVVGTNWLSKHSYTEPSVLSNLEFSEKLVSSFIHDFSHFISNKKATTPITIILDSEAGIDNNFENCIQNYISKIIKSLVGIHWIIAGNNDIDIKIISETESKLVPIQQNKKISLTKIEKDEATNFFEIVYEMDSYQASKYASLSEGIPYYMTLLGQLHDNLDNDIDEAEILMTSYNFRNYISRAFSKEQFKRIRELCFIGCWKSNLLFSDDYSAVLRTSIVKKTVDNMSMVEPSISKLIIDSMEAPESAYYINTALSFWKELLEKEDFTLTRFEVRVMLECFYNIWYYNNSKNILEDYNNLILHCFIILRTLGEYENAQRFASLYLKPFEKKDTEKINVLLIYASNISKNLGDWEKAQYYDELLLNKTIEDEYLCYIHASVLYNAWGKHKIEENFDSTRELYLYVRNQYSDNDSLNSYVSGLYAKYLYETNQLEKSVELAKESLEYQAKCFDNCTDVIQRQNYISALSNYILFLSKVNFSDQVIVFQKKIVDFFTRTYGDMGYDTLKAKKNLYSYMLKNNQIDLAIDKYDELISYLEKNKYDNSFFLFELKRDRIDAIAQKKLTENYIQAIDEGKKLLSQAKNILGTENTVVCTLEANIAYYYMNLQEYEKASHYAKRATERRKNILGENNPYTLDIADVYANALFFKEITAFTPNILNINNAIVLKEESCNKIEKYGNDEERTITAKLGLYQMYYTLGQFKKAHDSLVTLLERAQNTLEPTNNLIKSISENIRIINIAT